MTRRKMDDMAKTNEIVGGWTGLEVKQQLLTCDRAVCRAIVHLHKAQTSDEKAGRFTGHDNKIGFNKTDAKFGSSLAEQFLKGKKLSDKQVACARRMVVKYRNQLARAANAKFAVAVAEGLAGLVAFANGPQDVVAKAA